MDATSTSPGEDNIDIWIPKDVEGEKGRKAVKGRDKWKIVKASGVTAYGAPDGEPCGHIGAFSLCDALRLIDLSKAGNTANKNENE